MERLTKADIRRALEALAAALPAVGVPRELWVVGGAAVVMLYGARESTKDVDAFTLDSADSAELRAASAAVASGLGLPEDWLNDGAKGYMHGLAPGELLLEAPSLIVRSVAAYQLLAMKLSAWRDDLDVGDARLLLSKLSGGKAAVWKQVERHLVPGRELKGMPSTTCGRLIVDLSDLVDALVSRDALRARQWVADATRAGFDWVGVARPIGLDPLRLAVAAAVVEMIAARQGKRPPTWTEAVPAAPSPMYLVRAAESLPRLRRLCEEEGPEPLRRRGLLAPPDFLTAA